MDSSSRISWKPLRNLTVVYGLRYDIYKMPDANKNSPFPFSQHFNTDTNNVAPRFGLAYGLGKNERTVIRASTGIFYDPPQTDQYRRALLNNGSPAFFTLTAVPGLPYAPAFPNVLPAVRSVRYPPKGDRLWGPFHAPFRWACRWRTTWRPPTTT